MSNSSVTVHEQIMDSILSYIDTAYLTKNTQFNEARAELIKKTSTGPMFQEPLFEIIDR